MDSWSILTDDELDEIARLEALWDLECPPPPAEPELTMELRVLLFRHASKRLNLLDKITVPVRDLRDGSDAWVSWRDEKQLRPSDYEWVRLYEKGRPVATVSWGGALWSFADPDLPFMDESRCLYDPLGVNT